MPNSSLHHNVSNIHPEPSAGLFDRIIAAITQEKELRKTRKLSCFFLAMLIVSLGAMPFSLPLFVGALKHSGSAYFISTVLGNMRLFLTLWPDFSLSILESLPLAAITLFALNVALLLFSVRLFLHKKGLLLKYLTYARGT